MLLLFQKIPGDSINSQGYRREGEDDRKNRFGVEPFIQPEAAENAQQDDCQHLESHTGIAHVIVKRPFLLFERHPVLLVMVPPLIRSRP